VKETRDDHGGSSERRKHWSWAGSGARLMSAGAVRLPRARRMPDFPIRRAALGGRREGRRSLSAYGSHARGTRIFEGVQRIARGGRQRKRGLAIAEETTETGLGAAAALALVYPLVRRMRRALGTDEAKGGVRPPPSGTEGAECMKRKPSIRSLETVSLDEAMAYLDHANGDELSAAYALAWDRNRLDGSHAPPDDAEVHHALFLLGRARGRHPPSFDEMRVELRRRRAAA